MWKYTLAKMYEGAVIEDGEVYECDTCGLFFKMPMTHIVGLKHKIYCGRCTENRKLK